MGKSKSKLIPIVPLPRDQVALPGVTLRIRLANRSDIAALLAHIYSKAAAKSEQVIIGCVPVKSPYLNGEGQKLIEDGNEKREETAAVDPAHAKKGDLFTFGTMAKVTGVQGRRQGEVAIIVEGMNRFVVEKVHQEKPYFEAYVLPYDDEGRCCHLVYVLRSLTT